MSSRRHRRHGPGEARPPRRELTAAELDVALDGRTGGAGESLDELLAAARAPARPDELVGLTAALDAIRNPPPTTATRVRRGLLRAGAATAATKIVVLSAVGAAAVGGVVVAGTTGHLPGQRPDSRPSRNASATPSISTPPSASPTRSRSGSASLSGASSSASTSARPRTTLPDEPSASAGASLHAGAASVPALCRQWLALPPGAGPLKDQPKFEVLVRVAGGTAGVTGYCRRTQAGATASISASATVRPRPTPRRPTPRRPTPRRLSPSISRRLSTSPSREPGPGN